MRYYVTGANGFIGKHVVKYLQDKGHEVVPVKRGFMGHIQHLPIDKEFVFVHLSAYGNHYNQQDPYEIKRANIDSVLAVTDFCKHEKCRKLYNISTSSIQLPKQTLYSTSKHFGELMVESCNDPRFVNVRPYSVYGPGEAAHRFIPTVIRALRNDETIQLDEDAEHDWIFVEDFVEAMFSGYTQIGTGQSKSNLEILKILQEISGKILTYTPAKLRSYDTKDWVCKKGVPHISIEEGLKLTYERTA